MKLPERVRSHEAHMLGSDARLSRERRGVLDLIRVFPRDSPTVVRRTASVCLVGARPRVPRRAGERPGGPS